MKCAHSENKGNPCKPETCPRGLGELDWKELTRKDEWHNPCPYIRSDKWKPKET